VLDDETLGLRLMLTAGLCVAGGGAVSALVLYALSRASRAPLFPPAGPVRPSVNGFALAGAFVVFVLGVPLAGGLLTGAGFYQRVYGPDFPAGLPDAAANTVRFLWAATFAFPVQVGLIVWLVRAQGGVNPLHARGWSRNAVAGYLTWLLVTPAAFLVFVLANIANAKLTGQPPDKHPLTALGEAAGHREWALFVLQTVLLAPFLEELVFRGLLLPWLAQRRPPPADSPLSVLPVTRPRLVFLLAVAVAVVFQLDDVSRAWTAGDRARAAIHLIPGLFFLALVPLDLVPFRRLRRHLRVRSRQHVRAVLASAALFGAFHSHVWPSPVPLVVLAVGLGYLYLRTRSLVGPVVVHGMFNAVSAAYLLLGGRA
jgi:membrane protease YdiL (CAAX protease family)